METLVVGAGAMGRWFGTVLQESCPESAHISFCDTDRATAVAAAVAVGGEAVTPDSAGEADLVCIAVPIPAAPDAIEKFAAYAEQAIVDLTGTMERPLAAMRSGAPGCERASLHPLFAPENEPGNVPTVVDEGGPTVEAVLTALRKRGNDVFETTAERHDELMETVQARTHTAVLAFALASEPVPEEYHTPISSGLAELADQVIDGEARVYADIQAAFDGADDIADAAAEIAAADREAFEQLYEQAQAARTAGDDET
ncbi:MAG: prephenate dehydrogenase/arogenate dehydrogenase family protein [Halovenus sp.]